MKRLLMGYVCIFAISAVAVDMSKIQAVILDAVTDQPISGVKVFGSFRMNNGIRIWTESPTPNVDEVTTDVKGHCMMRGKTNVGHAGCWVSKAPEGYYLSPAAGSFDFKKKDIFGNWQPDNLVATIRLQRVEHPIPLLVKRVEWRNWRKGLLGLQGTNAVLRLDMVKGDWLPPYGHGETADLEIASELQITGKDRRFLRAIASEGNILFYDLVQTIRPTGTDDCISELHAAPTSGIKIRHGSDMGRSARVVRHRGMRKRIERTGNWECEYFDDTDDNRCYPFRIRSKYDEKGNLVEAYYGKIYGDFKFEGDLERGIISVRFLYYLNPTPLDRNLEWDMKSNLCTNPNLANLPQP